MNKIAISVLALGAAFAAPAFANETVHNGQRVTIASVEPAVNAGTVALAGVLSFASAADRGAVNDPARSAFSGK